MDKNEIAIGKIIDALDVVHRTLEIINELIEALSARIDRLEPTEQSPQEFAAVLDAALQERSDASKTENVNGC